MRKLISILLALCVLIPCFQLSQIAAAADDNIPEVEETTPPAPAGSEQGEEPSPTPPVYLDPGDEGPLVDISSLIVSAVENAEETLLVPAGNNNSHEETYSFVRAKTVNDVRVVVEAEEGVFPESAWLSVTAVEETDLPAIQEAVGAERREEVSVAASYTFDIKIMSEDGVELQPTDGNKVRVSFVMTEVADTNLTTEVYHVEEESGALNASKLETSEQSETVTVETDGFSYYTVEFTYENKQYVLGGDETVELAEILDYVGLTGTVTDAVSSNPELVRVYQEEESWYVSAMQAFHSNETLTVTINEVSYEILMTDDESYTWQSGGTYSMKSATAVGEFPFKMITGESLRGYTFGSITVHGLKDSSGTTFPVYCMQPNKEHGTSYSDATTTSTKYPFSSWSATVQQMAATALYWGYPNYNDTSYTAKVQRAALQAMIFDISCGFVVYSDGSYIQKSQRVRTAAGTYWTEYGFTDPDTGVSASSVKAAYNALLARMNDPIPTVGVPSFATQNGSAFNYLDLEYNQTTGLYEGTFTDTTSNYQYFNFTNDYGNGLVITQTGATLTITATPEACETYGIDDDGSPTKFKNISSTEPNRIISSSRVKIYAAPTTTHQRMCRYVKSSGDETYVHAHLALRAITPGVPLTITKSSSNTALTNGNSCYSLAGAQYGLYATSADATAGTNVLETLTTNASGQATSANNYTQGTYYMKELTPSPGYLLDTAVHEVTIASDGSISGNSFTEVPTDDPSLIRIRKVTSSGATTITSSSAVFRVDFYPNDNWSGTPAATWYYKTVNGLCFLDDETYLDTSRTNSARYHDSGGNLAFPLGTIRITEVAAPTGYALSNTVLDARVSQASTGALGSWSWVTAANGVINYEAAGVTYENTPVYTTLSAQKTVTGNLGDRSESFSFTIQLSDSEGVPITGSISYTGSRSGTITLNASGSGSFTMSHGETLTFQNIPVGATYTITEADYGSEGYTQTSSNRTGTVASGGSSASFTNARIAVLPTGVETGMRDTIVMFLFGALMLGGAMSAIRIKRKKNNA